VIPLVDLRAQYRTIADEIHTAISGVLESGEFILGREVAAFEHEFAEYIGGARYGVAVNSGTSALHLALIAAGIGPGDEVITTPFTFVATVAAIDYAGARPVFVDIDPHSFTIDVAEIEGAITERTKAILPVHLYGQPAEMDPILDLAQRHDLVVIEDAAQAHGAEYRGRRVGSLGDMGCFSFYPSKNLGGYGEGGIVLTDRQDFARALRLLRDWGQESKNRHLVKGFNYRMEAIQGAVLRVKLRHLPDWIEARRANVELYDRTLASNSVKTPCEMPGTRHAYHLYVVRTSRRAWVRDALHARGIATGIHYPTPVHLLEPWSDLGHRSGDFPFAEAAAADVLSLPMYAELSPSDIDLVCGALAEIGAADPLGAVPS
jgi:dTDP-4-amino-4,6-dideoxygalactose transaminase